MNGKDINTNEILFKVANYQEIIESIISSQYSFANERGPNGNCMIIDRFNRILNCEYSNGKLNGLLVVTNYDEFVCVYNMKDGLIFEEVDLSKLMRYHIVDLQSSNESCWEGDVLNGIPYGWGEVVDNNNHLMYVGFRIGEMNVCYGKLYNPSTGRIIYDGNWCFSKRWGFGRAYSEDGRLDYEGDWLDDQKVNIFPLSIVSDSLQLYGLNSLVESIRIGNECCNYSSYFHLKFLNHLKLIYIGKDSFASASSIVFHSLPLLETIVVADHSCENGLIYEFSCFFLFFLFFIVSTSFTS